MTRIQEKRRPTEGTAGWRAQDPAAVAKPTCSTVTSPSLPPTPTSVASNLAPCGQVPPNSRLWKSWRAVSRNALNWAGPRCGVGVCPQGGTSRAPVHRNRQRQCGIAIRVLRWGQLENEGLLTQAPGRER